MQLVDSHCHFHLLTDYENGLSIDQYLMRANESDVRYFLNVSVALREFNTLKKMAEQYQAIFISVGVHPNEQAESVSVEQLIQCASHHKVIAIGETGLDYYRSTGDLSWQQARFRDHIEAAIQLKLPLVIHSRQASADTISIMKDAGAKKACGVMHCFSEDWNMAKEALDLGFYISFSGNVTYKNADQLREVAKKVPLDRILIETDSPYLAPVPMRGKPNEPAYVKHTAQCIADLHHIPLDQFADQTTVNFFQLFKKAKRYDV